MSALGGDLGRTPGSGRGGASPWAPEEEPTQVGERHDVAEVDDGSGAGADDRAGAGVDDGSGTSGAVPADARDDDEPVGRGLLPTDGPLVGHAGDDFPAVDPALAADGRRSRRRSSGRRRRTSRGALLVAACLAAGLVGGVAGQRLVSPGGEGGGATVSVFQRSGGGGGAAQADAGSVAAVADAVLPSTVSIEITSGAGSGNGSGFVLSEDGYIVTNNHVVAPAVESSGRIRVLLSDGTREIATIVGRTTDYDLAVLQIDRQGLVPLAFASTEDVRVGDPVVAIGAPLGLASTVTSGIVSALNRPVVAGESASEQGFINAVQTDAAINPGNSGGPLVDLTGAVVGVNSAIAQTASLGGVGGSIGLGFAIPADQVRRTTTELIEDGIATYPVIGVSLDPSYEGEGVRVATGTTPVGPAVTPDGPADQGGVQPGDVITAVDDQLVTAPDELIVAIRARTPGEEIELTILRGRDAVDIPVTLGSEPSD
ncbi:S1C family serine protease [Pseudokineococcus sp. 1T1Z-3]|uniref:S1C family serine protease n=1 Tax=Pseudokineococcus sp. 1T1Z-3 TaxID=3132745 RepID=UPI0030A6D091